MEPEVIKGHRVVARSAAQAVLVNVTFLPAFFFLAGAVYYVAPFAAARLRAHLLIGCDNCGPTSGTQFSLLLGTSIGVALAAQPSLLLAHLAFCAKAIFRRAVAERSGPVLLSLLWRSLRSRRKASPGVR